MPHSNGEAEGGETAQELEKYQKIHSDNKTLLGQLLASCTTAIADVKALGKEKNITQRRRSKRKPKAKKY